MLQVLDDQGHRRELPPGRNSPPSPRSWAQGVKPAAIAAAATPGDRHGWPAAWPTDGLQQAVASQAYRLKLKNGRTKINAHTDEQSVLAAISSPTKTAYTKTHETAVNDQLVKATVRLADLLNAIAGRKRRAAEETDAGSRSKENCGGVRSSSEPGLGRPRRHQAVGESLSRQGYSPSGANRVSSG